MRFFQYLLIPIQPSVFIDQLIDDKRKLIYAIYALLLIGVLYTITVFVGYLNGFGAVVAPLLNIPPHEYYLWETFFCIPTYFIIVIVFAGTARLAIAMFGSDGSFENIFVLYSFSMFIPTIVTMWFPESMLMIAFPELRSSPLGGFRLWPTWVDDVRTLAGVLWTLVVTTIGVARSEKISLTVASFISLLAFLPTAALIILIIR